MGGLAGDGISLRMDCFRNRPNCRGSCPLELGACSANWEFSFVLLQVHEEISATFFSRASKRLFSASGVDCGNFGLTRIGFQHGPKTTVFVFFVARFVFNSFFCRTFVFSNFRQKNKLTTIWFLSGVVVQNYTLPLILRSGS